MVTVHYHARGLRVDGHAGYAAPGQDIVCAAVSTLCEVLRARFGGRSAPGCAEFACDRRDPTAKAVLRVFAALARAYPDCVVLKKIHDL